MSGAEHAQQLARQIGDPSADDTVLERWMAAVVHRSWKMRQLLQEAGAPQRSKPLLVLREHARRFLATLVEALRTSQGLETGAPGYREAVQSLAFTAGWMAGTGFAVTDAVALVFGLQDVLQGAQPAFFQALIMVVGEAFSASLVQRERALHREAMRKSQVVCDPHPRLPCLFLVGDPDRQAIEDAAGRVMMLAVMREAKAVLVDGSALLAPEKSLALACPILVEHSEAASVRVVISGAGAVAARELRQRFGDRMSFFDEHQQGMAAAMEGCGLRWSEG